MQSTVGKNLFGYKLHDTQSYDYVFEKNPGLFLLYKIYEYLNLFIFHRSRSILVLG
jgi:hypothetical protein